MGLRFCARAFSSCGKQGPLFNAVRGPLAIAASLVAEHRLQMRGSVFVAHGPSCSAACGIFPDQGSNPRPLHWQADSQPLRHQGSPSYCVLNPWHLAPCRHSSIASIPLLCLVSFSHSILQGKFSVETSIF